MRGRTGWTIWSEHGRKISRRARDIGAKCVHGDFGLDGHAKRPQQPGSECNRLIYKGECQGKYFSLDRKETFPDFQPLSAVGGARFYALALWSLCVVPSQQLHLLVATTPIGF